MSHYKLKGTSGSVINQSFPLVGAFVFGSSADCEVRIEEPGVADRHAEISFVGDHALLLRDLGTKGGTLLNGEQAFDWVGNVGMQRRKDGAQLVVFLIVSATGTHVEGDTRCQ